MPPPLVYSESIFADYLASVLDKLADALGWDASDPRVQEAVTDALLEYGESTISAITGGTNIRRLRALGRRAIWRAVVQATAGDYTMTDNGQTLERAQMQAQALKALELAEYECIEFSPTYVASVLAISRPHDPYRVIPDSERIP